MQEETAIAATAAEESAQENGGQKQGTPSQRSCDGERRSNQAGGYRREGAMKQSAVCDDDAAPTESGVEGVPRNDQIATQRSGCDLERRCNGAGGCRREASAEQSDVCIDEMRTKFRELIGGEYKQAFTDEVQRIIDRRFKKTKLLEQRLAELEGNERAIDNRPYEENGEGAFVGAHIMRPSEMVQGRTNGRQVAAPTGASVDELISALMENEQRDAQARRDAERLQRDVEALAETYPDLDAGALLDSDAYLRAYLDGAPLEDLLWAQHHDALVRKAQQSVLENIRARGARPLENGASGGATFTVHKDFSKMSLDELEAYGSKR